MKIGDLVRIRGELGFKNAGKYAIIIGDSFDGWWDIVFVDGQKGAVMRHVLEVVNECG